MGLQGFLDKCGYDSIAGWAWNPENPRERVSVDIFDGSRFLKRVRANCFRKDLEIGGKGQGVCAFNYVLPSSVLDDRLHQVHVQFADTAEELTRSPQFVVWSVSERRELEQTLRAFLKKPRWYIMSARFTRGRLEITGWALPPFDGRATTLRVNGASFDEVQMRFPSPECGNIFWYWPNSDRCRFVCRAAVQQADLFRNGRAQLEYADALTGEAHYSFHDFYWPPSLFTVGNIPADRDMVRAAGLPHRHLFLQGGYTTFVKLKQVIERKVGCWPKGETLDWGCGCGRVTRWLIDEGLPHVHVRGADIDPVNIRWCNENLPGAAFTQIPLHPRTPYREGQFSVILGMSVFTHLQESVQFEWLEELQRVAASAAILLMSVHGNGSVSRAVPSLGWLQRWRTSGFDATQVDSALAEVIKDKEYYRAAYHTTDYVQQHWSKYFEVIDIIESFMSNDQDLVVLRRR